MELKMMWRDPRFVIGPIALVALLWFATVYQQRTLDAERGAVNAVLVERGEGAQETRENLLKVEAGEASYQSLWDDPRGYYPWQRATAAFPLGETAFLSTGQRDLFASINDVTLFKRAATEGNPLAHPMGFLFGRFDPAFVLITLLPLLILALSFDLISSERERGTLALLRTQAVGPRTVILRRLGLRYAYVLFIVLASCLIAFALAGAPFGQAMAWLALFVAVYVAFWFLLAFWVNTWGRSSATNAMVLAMMWAGIALLVPATITSLGKQLYPVPSRMVQVSEERAAGQEAEREAAQLLAEFYNDHPEMAEARDASMYEQHQRFFDFYQRTFTVRAAVDEHLAPVQTEFHDQRVKRRGFEQLIALASPMVLMRESLDELAGVSTNHYAAYGTAVDTFSADWVGWFKQKAFQGQLVASTDLEQMPQFDFDSVTVETGHMGRILVLIGYALVFLVLSAAGRFGFR